MKEKRQLEELTTKEYSTIMAALSSSEVTLYEWEEVNRKNEAST